MNSKKTKLNLLSMLKISVFPLSKLLLAFSRIRFPVLPSFPLYGKVIDVSL